MKRDKQQYKIDFGPMSGDKYKYWGSDKVFELESVSKHGTFRFKCGHWCTDTVAKSLLIKIG